jgi:pimeloyl-ACP methyl ester carboxylesterase
MKRSRRSILVLIVITLFILVLGPFLIPLPPLHDTVPPEQLADPDSKFVTIQDVKVHYKMEGRGDDVLILLHGFGASTFTWHKVSKPLSQNYTVIAYDRTGFGYSSRPMPGEWNRESPYSPESQVEQLIALMDTWGVDKAVLVGSSAGGTIVALAAEKYPERVKALILVAAAIFKGGPPKWLCPVMRTPQVKRVGPLLLRGYYKNFFEKARKFAWHDPSKQTPEILEGYRKPMRVIDWDRALWEYALAYESSNLGEKLGGIEVPALVITGDDDWIVPPESSEKIADEISHAELVVISNTGHLPQEETPEKFLEVVNNFLEEVL